MTSGFSEIGLAVVDASVVIKWQLEDEVCTDQALCLLNDFYSRRCIRLIAPQLLVFEMINAMATAVNTKRLTSGLAVRALSNLVTFGVEVKDIRPHKILDFALRYNLAAYDAAYLALADDEKCELWTGDRRFYNCVKGALGWVRWIGDYTGRSE